jgi:hypothetical protein
MAQKYIQSTPDEKLTTSDFGAAVLQQLWPVTPVLYNYIEYDIWGGGWLFWDWLRSTTVYSSTSFCASLEAGRAGVCCVCAGVHRAPQQPLASLYWLLSKVKRS